MTAIESEPRIERLGRQRSNLLLIARRFWPLPDDATYRINHWMLALKSQGWRPTILTARWHPSWPDRFSFRGVQVHRVLPPPSTNWNETHYQRNVVQWIQKFGDQFDGIYCDQIDSALALLQSKWSRWDKPIIARFSLDESRDGMAPSDRRNTSVLLEPARRCETIVVPNSTSHRFLLSQGISEQQIVRIADPYWLRTQRTPSRRKEAAVSLAKLNGDMVIPNRTPLIVHFGIGRWKDLKAALLNVCDLLDSGVSLRMWVVNPGLPFDTIYEFLRDRGWHREILLFNGFDDIEELLQVADLAWITNPEETSQFTLPALIASGVPILLRGCPDMKQSLGNHVSKFSYNSPTDEALLLHRWYVAPDEYASNFNGIRNEFLRIASSSHNTEQWTRLLEQRVGAKPQ